MWNHILPKLIEGDKEATGRERLPYLVAFASLLPLVPASLCLSDLSTVRLFSTAIVAKADLQILPLLLRALSLSDAAQRINAITTLITILETQNMTAEVDTLLHQQANRIVEGLSKSYLIDPSGQMATSGVSLVFPVSITSGYH